MVLQRETDPVFSLPEADWMTLTCNRCPFPHHFLDHDRHVDSLDYRSNGWVNYVGWSIAVRVNTMYHHCYYDNDYCRVNREDERLNCRTIERSVDNELIRDTNWAIYESREGHVRINAGNPLFLRAISQVRAAVQLCIAMFIALIVNDLVECDRWCQVCCQLQPRWILTFVSIIRRDERVGRIGAAGWIVEQDDISFDALEECDQEQRNAWEGIHFLELLNNESRVLCFD